MRNAVAGLTATDLARKPPSGETTLLELVTGAAAHDVYHAGQIQLLKRLAARLRAGPVRAPGGP